MRVVADTNVVVSGLLWSGPPRQLLDAARDGTITLFTCAELPAELEETLKKPKLEQRMAQAGVEVGELLLGFASLARIVAAASPPPIVADDPEDDIVLACAVAVWAEQIVTGDRHLRAIGRFRDIPIISAAEFAAWTSRPPRAPESDGENHEDSDHSDGGSQPARLLAHHGFGARRFAGACTRAAARGQRG
jgi:putative PIN family toxin of toxin-antitoxin system